MPLLWPPFADVPVAKTLDDLKRLKEEIMPRSTACSSAARARAASRANPSDAEAGEEVGRHEAGHVDRGNRLQPRHANRVGIGAHLVGQLASNSAGKSCRGQRSSTAADERVRVLRRLSPARRARCHGSRSGSRDSCAGRARSKRASRCSPRRSRTRRAPSHGRAAASASGWRRAPRTARPSAAGDRPASCSTVPR